MQVIFKVMTLMWLFLSIAITLIVSYMCFTEGWKKWIYYYTFALVCYLMYLLRKYMHGRLIKHNAYMAEQMSKDDTSN